LLRKWDNEKVDICTGCSQKRVTLHLNLKSSGTDIVEEILWLR